MTSQLYGYLTCLLVLHGILLIITRHSLFYWAARLLDLLEAAQRSTWISLAPWLRRWRRQLALEMKGLTPAEKLGTRRESIDREWERLWK